MNVFDSQDKPHEGHLHLTAARLRTYDLSLRRKTAERDHGILKIAKYVPRCKIMEQSMIPHFHPQEIFLLERYSSIEYFATLRDVWGDLVDHVSSCLDLFMHDLPPNYRSAKLSEQPDVAWGHRVLPNFRNTYAGLIKGYILLSHGDVSALGYASGPVNDHKGQYDYSTSWMSPAQLARYESLFERIVDLAGNICGTEGAYWRPTNLMKYSERYSGPMNAPAEWPTYTINPKLSVTTGSTVTVSGVYAPEVNESSPQFLGIHRPAPLAYVITGYQDLLDPTTGEKYGEEPILERRPCTWYLVERRE
jgi:hypothetical protein